MVFTLLSSSREKKILVWHDSKNGHTDRLPAVFERRDPRFLFSFLFILPPTSAVNTASRVPFGSFAKKLFPSHLFLRLISTFVHAQL